MNLAPTVKLNNGMEMPVLGLGTYASKDDDAVQVIKHAIANGYRHIDTALLYENEAQVGQAIREKIADGTVKREEIFLVTKLWGTYHEPKRVEDGCRLSLKNLGLDYVDLFLMHSPMSYKYHEDNPTNLLPKDAQGRLECSDVDYVDTWKAMEKLVAKGLVKSIGVSNFNSQQLVRLIAECTIVPVTNQVECGPTINQKPLIKFCKDRGITVTAFSPLGRMKSSIDGKKAAHEDERVIAIATKYGKTTAQVILRYLTLIGVIPIPKTSNRDRVVLNLNIFDFELTEDEMRVMATFDTGDRVAEFLNMKHHKYWPFNIPY